MLRERGILSSVVRCVSSIVSSINFVTTGKSGRPTDGGTCRRLPLCH